MSRTVYRGIKLDLSEEYIDGTTIIWWGFSSCTRALNVLQLEQFLGKRGTRTRDWILSTILDTFVLFYLKILSTEYIFEVQVNLLLLQRYT